MPDTCNVGTDGISFSQEIVMSLGKSPVNSIFEEITVTFCS
ncbi:hypothetical protein CCAND95_1220001 [Capnocytophaga canis]|uniref:Uncharacterized protein n=1 Tax=Capnocytophaga canis TaxID=1848903 RepID=A0A0B7IMI6_9FLAO|nr:hypothetical protein CCAND95_1220001 [Capnocytophaga canis]CEN51824.1 hypothetical protein CCAND93_1940002 [Capnocytophaga canis]